MPIKIVTANIMKRIFVLINLFIIVSCTSQRKLAYLNNLPEIQEEAYTMSIPDYHIQIRDILNVTIKAMTPDGKIIDFLGSGNYSFGNMNQVDAGGYLNGYDVNSEGQIILPSIGSIEVKGLTLPEARKTIQNYVDRVYKNSTVECKLLSFKFTVIGEVRLPGAYINYNNYLTVLEAIGRAGGINDFGNRNNLLVIRPVDKGTKTFKINLQDRNILSSEGYFLLPNDVVIVQPLKNKIFSMNLPSISFVLSAVTSLITTTLLLINYLK
jgi:polysaccharide export outer membrane protein